LPGELVKEADEIATKIDDRLNPVSELTRKWYWLRSLAQYVADVQAGPDVHPVNVKGSDDRVTSAATTLRNAVRTAVVEPRSTT
jgi:hypothetical protein